MGLLVGIKKMPRDYDDDVASGDERGGKRPSGRRYRDDDDAKSSGRRGGGDSKRGDGAGTGGRGGMNTVKMMRSRADEEVRRMLRWLSFSKPKTIFGFDHLTPSDVPMMGNKSRGFSVCFDKVVGWRPPALMLRDLDSGDLDVSVQLSLSLFHLNSSSFFGSTWMGSPILLTEGDSIPDVIDFDYNEIVYMISRLTDPSCIGVVEIVASKIDKRKKVIRAQYG